MDWQQAASLAIVAVTVVLLVRGRLRARRFGSHDCCGECGKLETHTQKEYFERSELNNQGIAGWTPKNK
jgi:hypothetical protein